MPVSYTYSLSVFVTSYSRVGGRRLNQAYRGEYLWLSIQIDYHNRVSIYMITFAFQRILLREKSAIIKARDFSDPRIDKLMICYL